MKIVFIVGTRPEVLKVAPIIKQFKNDTNHQPLIINTQQQNRLCKQAFLDVNLSPDFIIKKTHNHELNLKFSHIQSELNSLLKTMKPDCVVVQGDTSSALAGALSAFYLKLPIVHIEAGLRSHSLSSPFPEEANRKMIACVASLNLSPNEQATKNLLVEGVDENTIALVGNPLMDCNSSKQQPSIKSNALITLHRRENHPHIVTVINTIIASAKKFPEYNFVFISHSHPVVSQQMNQAMTNSTENCSIISPVSHSKFIALLKSCQLVLTDSGGVQEEAAFFEIPTLIIRDKGDRPDGIGKKTHVVGTDTKIITQFINRYLTQKKIKPIKIKPTNVSHIIKRKIIEFIQLK